MTDDSPESRTHRRMVDEAMAAASEARQSYRQAKASNAVTAGHLEQLRNAVIKYHDALKRYRERSTISDEWQEYQLDNIDRLTSETVAIEEDNPRVFGGSSEVVEVPKLRLVDGDDLVFYLDGFDEVATKLGFAAEVREQTPHEIGTKKDIRWLLKARDQKQALDELDGPEQDAEEVANS